MSTKYVVILLVLMPLVLSRSSRITPVKPPDVYHKVKVTMYTIDPAQTDSTPLITASGFKLDSINPKRHRIIAVSRDLKRKYGFGKKVRVEGIGKWSGVYTIRDVMNKRFTNKIDILINPGERATSFRSAILYPLED